MGIWASKLCGKHRSKVTYSTQASIMTGATDASSINKPPVYEPPINESFTTQCSSSCGGFTVTIMVEIVSRMPAEGELEQLHLWQIGGAFQDP